MPHSVRIENNMPVHKWSLTPQDMLIDHSHGGNKTLKETIYVSHTIHLLRQLFNLLWITLEQMYANFPLQNKQKQHRCCSKLGKCTCFAGCERLAAVGSGVCQCTVQCDGIEQPVFVMYSWRHCGSHWWARSHAWSTPKPCGWSFFTN